MTQAKLDRVIASHKLWIKSGGVTGTPANLSGADLRSADLTGAYLRSVILRDANLRGVSLYNADLQYADLRNANLAYANLSNAKLCEADSGNANLSSADLTNTDLRGADLRYTNIDFSAWPLWCGSLSVKIDKRIAAQLLYHALRAMQSCANDPDVAAVLSSKPCLKLANQFHRAKDCGEIKPPERKTNEK